MMMQALKKAYDICMWFYRTKLSVVLTVALMLLQFVLPLIHAHPIGTDIGNQHGLHTHFDSPNHHVVDNQVLALSNPQEHAHDLVEVPSAKKQEALDITQAMWVCWFVLCVNLASQTIRWIRFTKSTLARPPSPFYLPLLRAPPL